MKKKSYQVQTVKAGVSVTFLIPVRYRLERVLGQGGYGIVCSARDLIQGKRVAVKQVRRVFRRTSDAKKILREIKLMKHFKHDNILGLMDIIEPDSFSTFDDVYLVTERMDLDLSKVIRKGSNYSEAHCKHFLYLILRGVKALHSANVLHRDLKPGNILVDQETCDIKICDFGLARGIDEKTERDGELTQYVTTRWYRAPEVICNSKNYTKAVDMWSVGCIFAELLGKLDGNTKPLFTGKDYADQLNKIMEVLGSPSIDTIHAVGDEDAKSYLMSMPTMSGQPLRRIFKNASDEAIDLLENLLAFDHRYRISVEGALRHSYLEELHDPSDEPDYSHNPFDFGFEKSNPDHHKIKEIVYDEMLSFHPELDVFGKVLFNSCKGNNSECNGSRLHNTDDCDTVNVDVCMEGESRHHHSSNPAHNKWCGDKLQKDEIPSEMNNHNNHHNNGHNQHARHYHHNHHHHNDQQHHSHNHHANNHHNHHHHNHNTEVQKPHNYHHNNPKQDSLLSNFNNMSIHDEKYMHKTVT